MDSGTKITFSGHRLQMELHGILVMCAFWMPDIGGRCAAYCLRFSSLPTPFALALALVWRRLLLGLQRAQGRREGPPLPHPACPPSAFHLTAYYLATTYHPTTTL